MGVRDTLNRNRTSAIVVGALLLVVALGALLWQRPRPDESVVPNPSFKAWFTVDDGKRWFADDATQIPPFLHDGKEAVRCYVFTCDGGKTTFVAFLQRYPPRSKKAMEELRARGGAGGPTFSNPSILVEVKRPMTGAAGWMLETNAAAASIMKPKCPDGSNGTAVPVMP
jgi:hypothetical protein